MRGGDLAGHGRSVAWCFHELANLGKNRVQGQTDIASFSLVCGPPCKPPKKGDEKKDYSHGKKKTYPKNPKPEFVTPVLP